VRAVVARGVAGRIADTPKPGDPRLARASAQVIAGRDDALDGAERAARALGYHVVRLADPVVGEARVAAPLWFARVAAAAASAEWPLCVLSAGETTVRVTGGGTGGRNQEFVLALIERDFARATLGHALASVGTDGIDGPTDAAGALLDHTSRRRARESGLAADDYLAGNNAYAYFDALGDLIRLGRTDTNVGDLQICLII
jgi:hydroxypyruvate reductase